MARYGMVIDLARCVGCCGCTVTCKVEHFLPPGMLWARVLFKESGEYPAVQRKIMPILCNHCRDAACVRVCPTGATQKRADGLVTIDDSQCIGCRYCMMACPYGSRHFYDKMRCQFPEHGLTPYESRGYAEHQVGVVMKCNFCQERIDSGLEKGLKPGIHREATPACVNSCIGQARHFGDLDDYASEVSELIRVKRANQMHPEFATDPSVYYIV